MSVERQEYLKNAVNVESFLNDLDTFCKKVDAYWSEKQWLSKRYEELIALTEDGITGRTTEKIFLNE